jgi:hypothetical protein
VPLEFSDERHELFMRVDGDILEIFSRGAFGQRVPLAWLAVQLVPAIRGHLNVRITAARFDVPLYEVQQKANIVPGMFNGITITTEEEPRYRQFFTEVAELCGRPVMP